MSGSECLHLEPFMVAALASYGPLWRSVRGGVFRYSQRTLHRSIYVFRISLAQPSYVSLASHDRCSLLEHQAIFVSSIPACYLSVVLGILSASCLSNNGTAQQDTGGLLYGRRATDSPRNHYSDSGLSTAASPPVQPRPQPRNGYCNKHGSAAQPAASRSGRTRQPWSKATQSLTQPISHTTTRAMGHKLTTSRPQGNTTSWPGQRPGPRQ